jgi:hypothetical protein
VFLISISAQPHFISNFSSTRGPSLTSSNMDPYENHLNKYQATLCSGGPTGHPLPTRAPSIRTEPSLITKFFPTAELLWCTSVSRLVAPVSHPSAPSLSSPLALPPLAWPPCSSAPQPIAGVLPHRRHPPFPLHWGRHGPNTVITHAPLAAKWSRGGPLLFVASSVGRLTAGSAGTAEPPPWCDLGAPGPRSLGVKPARGWASRPHRAR